jgi:hypothetical protein
VIQRAADSAFNRPDQRRNQSLGLGHIQRLHQFQQALGSQHAVFRRSFRQRIGVTQQQVSLGQPAFEGAEPDLFAEAKREIPHVGRVGRRWLMNGPLATCSTVPQRLGVPRITKGEGSSRREERPDQCGGKFPLGCRLAKLLVHTTGQPSLVNEIDVLTHQLPEILAGLGHLAAMTTHIGQQES